MKRVVTAIAITSVLAAAATQQYLQDSANHQQSDLQSRLHVMENTLSETQQNPMLPT